MTTPIKLKERADAIRAFIRQLGLAAPGLDLYKARRFQDLFRLSEQHTSASEGRPSNPGMPRRLIRDGAEKAFQRAIFYSRFTEAKCADGTRKLVWLDYELPIVPGNTGRRLACVDLIVRIEDSITICEVKYLRQSRSAGSLDPDHAILELMFQLQAVALNAHLLDTIHHKGFEHFSWTDVATAKLAMVVANRNFWNRMNQVRVLQLVSDIREKTGIQILLFGTEDISFPQDRRDYEPEWQYGISSHWESVLELQPSRADL